MIPLQILAGVIGGFFSGLVMYFIRQKQKRDGLRTAIGTEIQQSPVDALETSFRDTHSLETPVIDSNLDRLHLLSRTEVQSILDYHEQMERVRRHTAKHADEEEVNIPREMAERTASKANTTQLDLGVRVNLRLIRRFRRMWKKRQEQKNDDGLDPEEQREKIENKMEKLAEEEEQLKEEIRQNS